MKGKGIQGILMKYEGKTIDKDLCNKIHSQILRLFEQDDYYYCYICSSNLGKDCPEGYGCGNCCEIGFYCEVCAEEQKYICLCGEKLK
jgi:hypothetical protein